MIVIASLHTAHEIIMRVPGWRPGDVSRAEATVVTAGGKPLNVARFAGRMGADVRLLAAADAVLAERMAHDASLRRMGMTIVTTVRHSRTDIALVDADGAATVVNGEPSTLERFEADRVVATLRRWLGLGDRFVLAGSLPGPAPVELLVRVIALARRATAELIVDASGPILAAALDAHPTIVKVTADELAAARGGDPARAWEGGRELAPEPENLIVTGGSRGLRAWLADGSAVEVRPPLVHAVNTLGAGDAVTAGIALTLDTGGSLQDGLVLGTAMAAARLNRLEPDLDPERARALQGEVSLLPLA